MSDKIYILTESYSNDMDYEDYECYVNRFVGVFSTEEEAIIVARKMAIHKLDSALASLTHWKGYFKDYKEYRDRTGTCYTIDFNQSEYGDPTYNHGSYTYDIVQTCMNEEPESHELESDIDIQPSYESIKAAEAAFNNLTGGDKYKRDHFTRYDINEIEKDFSEEFIREQNNLSNGKEV